MNRLQDEDLPYRASVASVLPSADDTRVDESHYDTLRAVHTALKDGMDGLDEWHAFDLTKSDGLTVEQQIVAHRKAFDILVPVFQAVNDAIIKVDEKYKER